MKRISKLMPTISEEFALSDKERAFASFLAEGKGPEVAYKLAGFGGTSTKYVWELVRKQKIITYAQRIRARNEHMTAMSRKRVMDGFLEAIEQAKLMSEPMTQIAGWREIAKMCGYFAPEVRKIDINITSQRILSQLETLSDADLLEMIEKDAETIEGESREFLTTEFGSGSIGDETAAGAGEQSTGTTELDPLRETPVPELQRGVGA